MIQIADIYVSTTGYLLHMINIRQYRLNSQHYLLAHHDSNRISIDNYKRNIFPTFMLADGVYNTRSLNLLYMEVLVNIQC